VTIDVTGVQPLSGLLRSESYAREFEGWIELLAALERAVSGCLPDAVPDGDS
jgi:hypothetical protein